MAALKEECSLIVCKSIAEVPEDPYPNDLDRNGLHPNELRILIVDGNATSADRRIQQLGELAFHFQIASCGYAAMELSNYFHPHVVMIQLDSDWLDGCRFSRDLRVDSACNDALIIGVTSCNDERSRRLSVVAGIDILLVEPIDIPNLETILLLESIRCLSHSSHDRRANDRVEYASDLEMALIGEGDCDA